jgi:hypothetical protein
VAFPEGLEDAKALKDIFSGKGGQVFPAGDMEGENCPA